MFRALIALLVASMSSPIAMAAHQKAPAAGPVRPVGGISAPAGFTPLMVAAMKGELGETRRIIARNSRVDERNAYGQTALDLALQGYHFEIVLELLAHGAHAAWAESDKSILVDCMKGDRKAVAKKIADGANVNETVRGAEVVTPLSIAARRGDIPLATELMKKGARSGWRSPLFHAADAGQPDFVRWLFLTGKVDPKPEWEALAALARMGDIGAFEWFASHGVDLKVKAKGLPLLAATKRRKALVDYFTKMGVE